MLTPLGPRKRMKHFDLPRSVHELTFSCYGGLSLLEDDRFNRLLSRAIDAAVVQQQFHLLGFVYMPEHVHLVVLPLDESARVASLLYAIKRPHSYRVKKVLQQTGDTRLEQLMVLERPGRRVFRFWQEGGGYDRNLASEKTILAAIHYAHANPVRRGLCSSPAEWKWSSWRHYEGDRASDPDLPRVHGFL